MGPVEVIGLLILLAIASVPGWIARWRGHNFWLFWVGGIIAWPVALIAAFAVKRRRPCPLCKESIARAATVCPHCQRDVATPSAVVAAAPLR